MRAGGPDERVECGLIVARARVSYDDLDVIRSLGDPLGDEPRRLVRSAHQTAVPESGNTRVQAARRDGRRAGTANIGEPFDAAQRVHQLRRSAGHVQRGRHAETAKPLERFPAVQMDVRVDQSGQQHTGGTIDDAGTVGIRDDPAGLDDDRAWSQQLPAVEDADIGQGGSGVRRRAGQ